MRQIIFIFLLGITLIYVILGVFKIGELTEFEAKTYFKNENYSSDVQNKVNENLKELDFSCEDFKNGMNELNKITNVAGMFFIPLGKNKLGFYTSISTFRYEVEGVNIKSFTVEKNDCIVKNIILTEKGIKEKDLSIYLISSILQETSKFKKN